MKNSVSNARRWVKQAEFDLRQAKKSLEDSSFAYAAFFAEQSAQKSLKGFLFARGARAVVIHSIAELAREAGVYEPVFLDCIERGAKLDRHYIASRYPDALPEPAVPFESYAKDEAQEAIRVAEEIFDISKKFIS